MKGFNPIINGVQINNQADNWRWNNVVAYNGKEYRLVDALTGKDLLGLGFNRQEKYNELVLELHDSLNIGYSVKNSLMNVSGDDKELVYTVIPEFETHISKQVAKGNIVSLVFQENRQCIFDCLHGSRIITENKERNQQALRQLMDNEQQKIASILENGNDSIVKSQISRQLCKGVSCSWLINSLGKDYSVNDDAFFGYLAAFVNYANSYYFEKLYVFNNTDWDGDFEKMMQAYITLRENRREKPQDQYLQLTVPLLINYYYETNDYGLKTSLYSKIVRLQQLAILYGLGDNDWAHESLPSPVGIDINSFYREYR